MITNFAPQLISNTSLFSQDVMVGGTRQNLAD